MLIDLLVFNSNTECLCCDKILNMKLDSLPSFDISTSINNNPSLSNVGIDLHLPISTNFKYFTTHEFHSCENIQSSANYEKAFSALNFNVRSLASNFDEFVHLLNNLNYQF